MKKIIAMISKLSLLDIVLLMSPFLDLLICAFQKLGFLSPFGLLIRGVFLIVLLVYALVVNKKTNKKIVLYMVVLCIYMYIFCINTYLLSSNYLFTEVKSMIKYMFFPFTLCCILLINNKPNTKLNNSFFYVSMLYMLFLILPQIFNAGFSSYDGFKLGSIGWFYSPNEISSIVSILCPFVFYKILDTNDIIKKLLYLAISIMYIYSIFNIGTKTPAFATFIVVVAFMVMLIINIFKHKTDIKISRVNLLFMIVLLMFSIFCFKNSSSFTNVENQSKNYYESVTSKVYSEENINELKKNMMQNHYNAIYEFQDIPNYKTNKFLNLIFSSRDIYFQEHLHSWKKSNINEKIFGMGQVYDNQGIDSNKLIEIDFLDIFFGYGVAGFVVYFSVILYIGWTVLKYLLSNFDDFISKNNLCASFISICIGILLSLVSGHVFGAPSVSLIFAIIISNLFTNIKAVKLSNKHLITKKAIIYAAIIITLIPIYFTLFNYFNKYNNNFEISIVFDNNGISLDDNKLKSKLINKSNISSEYATDVIETYEVTYNSKPIAKFILVSRTFDNDIKFNYITGKNLTGKNLTFSIKSKPNYISCFDLNKKAVVKDFSTLVGYDKTTLPDKYLEFESSSSLLYNVYIYSISSINYDGVNHSIVKILDNQSLSTDSSNSKYLNKFVLKKNQYFDTLIVSGNSKLFNNEEEINLFTSVFSKSLSSSWLSFDGAYTKLPYSIEPYTPDGYGRNLNSEMEKGLFKLYCDTGNLIYEDYVLSSIHVLKNYLPRYKNGVWLTEYTSTWLKKDYGIKAMYFDTGHNDTIAEYLINLYNYYNNDDLKNMSEYYAKYLLEESNKEITVTLKEGILPPDYFSTHHYTNSHCSLNHQLAIINYLLRIYIQTNNEEYKNLALTYLKTITNIGMNWINEEGDLYYQVNEKGIFSGTDYKTLTLEDLVITQELLEQIGENRIDVLDELINSKLKYLNKINYNIDNILVDRLKVGGYIE